MSAAAEESQMDPLLRASYIPLWKKMHWYSGFLQDLLSPQFTNRLFIGYPGVYLLKFLSQIIQRKSHDRWWITTSPPRLMNKMNVPKLRTSLYYQEVHLSSVVHLWPMGTKKRTASFRWKLTEGILAKPHAHLNNKIVSDCLSQFLSCLDFNILRSCV